MLLSQTLLEICAFSTQAAITAINAGADRIELCANPELDGISPPFSWYAQLPGLHYNKLAIMVRPRGGNFVYSDEEISQMEQEIILLRHEIQPAAVVFGALTADNDVDEVTCKRLVQAAQGMEVVFHRAFDQLADPLSGLQKVIDCGFHRILCGLPMDKLLELKAEASGRIVIMPGGGIRSANIKTFMDAGFEEIHTSARLYDAVQPDEAELRLLIEMIKK